ncbi:MAG: ATP synthase F1 subunit delta [Candidatus Marinimicrobia bacterium]|nr:ATP synthase F1 subunit delta [Candidatus Neomarinimicrobiota bacterium]|tara:strand:+ start:9693 stop:10226 length:534 start_codon:yes stop_codon:yes gene_type:complete
MRLNRQTKHYGEALFNASKKIDAVENVHHSLTLLTLLLKKDAAFRAFFYTRRIESEEKSAILEKVLGEQSHPLMSSLFAILSEKREYRLVFGIHRWFSLNRQKELAILPVTAFATEALLQEDIDSIQSSVENSMSKRVELSVETEEVLLGGIKFRMGNLFLDGSIRGRLDRLKNKLQ